MPAERVLRVRIEAPPEAVWAALTDPARTVQWYFGTEARSSWRVGERLDYYDGDALQITGRLLAYDPPRSFRHEFIATWGEDDDDQGTLTWTVEPDGTGSLVTLVHAGGHGDETAEGSQQVLGSLKSYLESAAVE
ncbi:MAG: SRPBCC domain-containing protein [Microbacteriaceae bacterium]|nr:SRPBCC domain-containing protein [Microbacteriaceae bacterium]